METAGVGGDYTLVQGGLDWRVSKACESGACIMVASQGDAVLFGNTNHPDGPTFAYTKIEWKEFLAGVKRGDFDEIV
jgi:predicted secreted Zn-dependent protease